MSPDPAADAPTTVRLLALALLYVASTLAGGLIFVGLIRAAAHFGPGVMFYRGVLALAIAGAVLIGLLAFLLPRLPRRYGLSAADSLGGAIVAVCLLLTAFVLGPITVDRSVSVFLLSRFEGAGRPLSEQEARDAFVNVYVGEWSQVARRLREQEISGNLEHTPQGWRMTAQGRAFMRVARFMSALFDGDPRFVARAR